ncbi:unnamed protein product [Phaedon cochleariae]|uniref:RING-type domain-containing protein n=1 Tax=Phaedon cochleariae TaxID=80249 RepID=A0A9N9X7I4_PHACE|nr:unnamed protein product [Phaedon cochleariae]
MAESLEPQINKELQNAMNAILSKKCCLCKNVLSVPPIMILSQDGTQSKCGRCELSKIRVDITIVSKNEYKDNNKANDTATVDIPKNDVNIVDECLEKFKKQLQCPICMEYMIGKIYNCEKGHVLCDTCKLQLTECPSCRASLGESRSFPLESLADEVVLACVFSKNGCEFTGKLKLLSPHEKECVHKQKTH